MGPYTPLLTMFLLSWWLRPLQGQQHHLVEYMERRLAALEVSGSLFVLGQAGWKGSTTLVASPSVSGIWGGDDKVGLCEALQNTLTFY